jgi:hypothetical protein
METKVIIIITVHLMLGILGSILFLKDIYRTYGELTLGDILTFLIIAPTGPITLLALLTKYLDRFKILKK